MSASNSSLAIVVPFMSKGAWFASTTPSEREELRAEEAARLAAESELLIPRSERPTYEPDELLGALRRLYSDRVAVAEASRIAAEGRVHGPLFGVGAPAAASAFDSPQRISDLGDLVTPPAERFLWGRAVPLGKSTLLFGPGGVGKSAWLAQLVYAVASYTEKTLHGRAVSVHGPVLVVSAEDTSEDWRRKAAAIHHGTETEVPWASERVHVRDLTDGEARLSVRERDGSSRATALQDEVITWGRALGAVLIVVETASRLVVDEDNASFSALQSALGRIARETGAAVIITHHATKASSRENDSSIEAARGGGSLVNNARNALAFFPADPKVAGQLSDQHDPAEVFEVHHGKSTSSTRREDSVVLVRRGVPPFGAVFHLPGEVEADPAQATALRERADKRRARQVEDLGRLFDLVKTERETRPKLSRSWLAENRHDALGMTRRRLDSLIGVALKEGVLRVGKDTRRGAFLEPGFDPRVPVGELAKQ